MTRLEEILEEILCVISNTVILCLIGIALIGGLTFGMGMITAMVTGSMTVEFKGSHWPKVTPGVKP